MKQAYPVIITKDKDFFVASIPDFETGTQGESLAEAIEMARDAIGMCGCYMQDEKKDIPIPTDIGNVTKEASDILTLVDVDFDEYRKKHEMRTVRKNVTIPSWLNEEAESANINFSALLQKAIKAELHLL
jgi:hypothetical protein